MGPEMQLDMIYSLYNYAINKNTLLLNLLRHTCVFVKIYQKIELLVMLLVWQSNSIIQQWWTKTVWKNLFGGSERYAYIVEGFITFSFCFVNKFDVFSNASISLSSKVKLW